MQESSTLVGRWSPWTLPRGCTSPASALVVPSLAEPLPGQMAPSQQVPAVQERRSTAPAPLLQWWQWWHLWLGHSEMLAGYLGPRLGGGSRSSQLGVQEVCTALRSCLGAGWGSGKRISEDAVLGSRVLWVIAAPPDVPRCKRRGFLSAFLSPAQSGDGPALKI